MLSKNSITNVEYQIPLLQTERLFMREFRLEDFDTYADLVADPVFRRYLGNGDLLNREMAWRAYTAMMGHWVLRGFGFWALEDKVTGEYVGHVGIHYPEDWPDVEIGWGINPKFQNLGYGHEAAKKAMQFGFEELGFEHLISLIVEGNRPSVKLAKKLNEKYTKTIEMMGLNVEVYRITRQEYLATK